MNKIFLMNVGVNASHGGLRSPIFSDGTFEFIPIPEKGRNRCPECKTLPRYCDLKAFNNIDLLQFIPKKYHSLRVHNDPEFESFTYGDYPEHSPRAANLKKFIKNAHVQRALYDPKFWNGFWVFKGSKHSQRFHYAIPFTKRLVSKVLKDAKGNRIDWQSGRTTLQVIGSYTRACRMVDGNEAVLFWKAINRKLEKFNTLIYR